MAATNRGPGNLPRILKTGMERRAQQGFSLVELMIVVAIIGILASIAIPNYQKYQAKARTSEGKIQLAAAYTAQKSFYVEYSSYTGCIGAAGYAPDLGTQANPSSRYYATGLTSAASSAASCGTTTTGCNVTFGNGNPTCAAAGSDGTSAGGPPAISNGTYWSANTSGYPNSTGVAAGHSALPTTTVATTAFTMAAAGNINPSTNSVYDQWTISDGKVVTQINVGY